MTASTGMLRAVRVRMEEEHLSVRGLARRAGLSHSVVSRFLNGHSHPSVPTLRALAGALDLTLDDLTREAPGEGWGDATAGARLLASPPQTLVRKVTAELDRLRAFAGTEEGRLLARELFERKVENIGASGPLIERLKGLQRLYLTADNVAPGVRAAAGSAVLYFIQAVDAIDDFLWPIGYLDDAIALELAEAQIARLTQEGPEMNV
ncbi:MAG: helix-turn-helix domain-containing protein [Firmicutes bacterium]|nr:helix-turn-helix domain-containing protein [Bacillota bacterium]